MAYLRDTVVSGSLTVTDGIIGSTISGALQTNDITIANGDKLVVTDASDSNKIARTSLSFDGSTTTKALTQKGTFETFLTSAPVTSVNGSTGAVSLTIPSITTTTVTLSASSWSGYTTSQDPNVTVQKSVTVSGVTASNIVIITPNGAAGIYLWGQAGIKCASQSANSLTFYANTTPTADLNINVMIID